MIYNSILELVGKTPLLKLNNIEKKYDLKCNLYAKLEYLNPAGSIKDRTALKIIEDFEKKGLIKKGATIIEPTSGNTGIGLAMVCKVKRYKLILVMPDTMSVERIQLVKAYGAEVYLTKGELGMKGSIEKANELNKEIKGSIIAGQFTNESNVLVHYETTGPEIYQDLNGKVDCFVATFGTGGTITGTSKFLKEKTSTYVVGVEPLSSPLLTKGYAGSHKIQGIGANFVPEILDTKLIDEIFDCEDEKAFEYGKVLANSESILCGISSGACLYVGIEIAKRKEFENKNVVIILPDSGDRYMSTTLFK